MDWFEIQAAMQRAAKRLLFCILRLSQEHEGVPFGAVPYDLTQPNHEVKDPLVWLDYLLSSPTQEIWYARMYPVALIWYENLAEDYRTGRLYRSADRVLYHETMSVLRESFTPTTALAHARAQGLPL